MTSQYEEPRKTAPLETESSGSFAERFFAPHDPCCAVRVAGGSHVGRVRTTNEDSYAIVKRTRSRQVLASNLPRSSWSYPDDHAYMLVVADGVGGEAFGDFASQLALETAFELAGAATSWVMKLTDLNAQQMRARIDAYCQQIQATLRRYGQVVPELRGMATTWTSAYVLPPHVVVTHIGDSRAYQYRGSKLWQITQDQTIAEQLKGAGMPDDAVRQFRHVLTNCLGGQQDEVTAEIYQTTLSETDRLLLCTDGLSDMVAEEEIIRLLSKHNDTQEACDQLIEAALEQGGKDNVTVALCDVGTPSESS